MILFYNYMIQYLIKFFYQLNKFYIVNNKSLNAKRIQDYKSFWSTKQSKRTSIEIIISLPVYTFDVMIMRYKKMRTKKRNEPHFRGTKKYQPI